ncbi:MAG: transcription termination/antitermination protein NusG [Planctomycetota bacterium]|jgi:transcriptional antiterminator RfaH
MKRWYTLYTKPRSERAVALLLQQHEIETYLPEITATTAQKTERRVPFFPSYLFIRLDLKVDNPTLWRWVPGVRRLVSYGDRPVAVPDEIINLIGFKLAELDVKMPKPFHQLKPGDMVKITSSPFKDMLAIFEGPTTPSDRVYVLLTSLNNSVRLRIAPSGLEKVSGKVGTPANKRPRRSRGRGRPIN